MPFTCPKWLVPNSSEYKQNWKQTLDTFLRLVSTEGQRPEVQEWSNPIECKKAWICWSVWAGAWEALDHMPESLPLFNNAALPLLTEPHLPALISISMSASCSQYVITILPGFLALTANLKLQRLRFVRIQLVKRSGTKEAASLWTIMPSLRNNNWINALLIGSKCQKLIHQEWSGKLSVIWTRLNLHLFQLGSCAEFVTSSGR